MSIDLTNGIAGADLAKFMGVDKANIDAILGQSAGFTPPTLLGGFHDEFSGVALDAAWEIQNGGGAISVGSGTLNIAGGINTMIRTVSTFDMTGKTLRVQFKDVPGFNYNQQICIAAADDGSSPLDGYIFYIYTDGNMYPFRVGVGNLAIVAFNPAVHKFFQLRLTGGNINFEVSAVQDSGYSSIFSEAIVPDVTNMHAYLRTGNLGGAMKFDNFDSDL